MTTRIFRLAMLACTVAAVAVPAYAGPTCPSSPENPTLILGGLASGAYAVSILRTRLRARRSKQS